MFRFQKKEVIVCFLAVFGMGFFLSFLILCNLGTDPATFMNRSGAARIGLSFGTWQLIVNAVMLAVVFAFKRSLIGFGTVFNMVLVGYYADFFDWLWGKCIPAKAFTAPVSRWAIFLVALLCFIISAAVYINADMGVAPYLVASTLEAVLAQRLVRTNCRDCRTPYEPDDEVLRRLSLTRDQVGNRSFYYGRGCSVCNNTGYKGRKGIFEYLRVGPQIREMINERKPTLLIRERAREIGMRTMREDGVRNILDGYTSVDEVLRYT